MSSTKSFIDITEIYSLIENKPFSEIKKINFDDYGLMLREHRDLYLIVANRTGESPFYETLTVLQQQCNGLIFEKETNRLISGAPKLCIPISRDNLKNYFFPNVDQTETECVVKTKQGSIRLEYCEDGTIIRLYNYRDVWYTSTTKCIDAKESYWSSEKTFDSMFWDVFDKKNLVGLDKNFTYIFILLHTENRIVVRHKFNRLVFISKIFNHIYSNQLYSNNKMCVYEDFANVFYGTDQQVKRPKLIESMDLQNINSVYLNNKRGVIVKVFDNLTASWNSFILDFENYSFLKTLRGNMPNIQSRYLDLMKDKKQLYLLQKFYPEFRTEFTDINKRLSQLCQYIYELYIFSHIKHTKTIKEENPFFKTLKALHAQYKVSSQPIKYADVKNKITTHFNGKTLLKIIENWENNDDYVEYNTKSQNVNVNVNVNSNQTIE